jgi:hypothetical protein
MRRAGLAKAFQDEASVALVIVKPLSRVHDYVDGSKVVARMGRKKCRDLRWLIKDGMAPSANSGILAESREHNAKTMRSFASKMRRPAEMVMVIRYTNPLACNI